MTFDVILHRVPDSNVRNSGVSLESSFLQTKHRFALSTGMVDNFSAVHTIVIRYTIMICEAANSEKVFLTLASHWNKENLNVLKKLKRPAVTRN